MGAVRHCGAASCEALQKCELSGAEEVKLSGTAGLQGSPTRTCKYTRLAAPRSVS